MVVLDKPLVKFLPVRSQPTRVEHLKGHPSRVGSWHCPQIFYEVGKVGKEKTL